MKAFFMKILFFFFVSFVLISYGNSQTQDNSTKPILQAKTSNSPLQNKIPQKLADKPKDTPIKLINERGQMRCYIPAFTHSGKSYLYISTCRTSWAKPARYDVFGRIAYFINGAWFCLTAPQSVAETKRASKDYIALKPCVINDKKQQFKIKDDLIYSTDESYYLKDDGDYVFAVNISDKSLRTSKLDKSMKEWANTIATPVNLTILTSLAWDYTTKDGNQRFFLYNNGSKKNTTDLYYNLESGHIAQMVQNQGFAELNCLYAHLNNPSWAWTWWTKCSDTKPPQKNKNKAYWKFVPISPTQALLVNYQGAVLRLAGTGLNWGKPYVASADYLAKDKANYPTSFFVIDKDTRDWLRFIDANIGDNLPFCPAPAPQNLTQKLVKSPLQNPPLPNDFTLSDEWRRRLWEITNTNDNTETIAGVCGVCLLQSFQMVAELLENPQTPRTSGGYFFDTQERANPFHSFRARNSLLYDSLNDITQWFPRFMRRGSISPQDIFEHNNNLAMMSAIALLPQYDWNVEVRSHGAREVLGIVQNHIFNAQSGSVFIVLLRLLTEEDEEVGHAIVSIRTNDGVVMIPTNTYMDLDYFNEFSAVLDNALDFLETFENANLTVRNIALLSPRTLYPNIFAGVVSFNDCSGFGDDRRGSGALPASEMVNQCASGRCFE